VANHAPPRGCRQVARHLERDGPAIRTSQSNAEAAKNAKEKTSSFAAFALAKPKVAESLASERWAFAFQGGD
jgi:prephenate dehydratase